MVLAKTWVVQHLTRTQFMSSLETFSKWIAKGRKLRLLCHCRPHVRCHTEFLKAQLELRAAELGWMPDELTAPIPYGRWQDAWPDLCESCSLQSFTPCATSGCGRVGRAIDPMDHRHYCTFCW